ncbi:Transaldolase [Lachnellula hyalina]|uniref:Transaldolase n=1 Tax=Lachnellula hyalina TaxID=1316788 RepID=A0A8H8U0N3_9HELO|nr:Transaldolase [Lachnellula hyalina]TVY27505.1 Transaldolase [Lachnellula hyalina]
MAPQTLLQLLQSRSIVDCDTMDVEVPKTLGQFVDCTSNQAIAYGELAKPNNQKLVEDAVSLSKKLTLTFPDIPRKVLAGEIAMVKLQYGISKHVTGFVHIQTNPYHSYDTEKTVSDAQRIIQLFKILDPGFEAARICIKIPSTWEGLQACKILQASGVTTLATTLFTIEQAALAGEVGCHYIAPYVNELKVHFDPGFVDNNKAQSLCLQTQRYYEAHKLTTQVLPASLTCIEEIMALAGVNHITIAPGLLKELSWKPAAGNETVSLFDEAPVGSKMQELLSFAGDEKAFRIAFTLSGRGEGERKLDQAINIFCEMQDKMELLMG